MEGITSSEYIDKTSSLRRKKNMTLQIMCVFVLFLGPILYLKDLFDNSLKLICYEISKGHLIVFDTPYYCHE